MMFWYGHDLSAFGWAAMTLGTVMFWGLLIAAAVWAVRTLGSHDRSPGARRPADPEQVLAERFARGEIDETEYNARLTTLRAAGARGHSVP